MKRIALAPIMSLLCSCGSGDNSAIRAFYSTVQVGNALPDLIAAGEKAQSYDIEYFVSGRECPGDDLYIRRHNEEPSIRVSQRAPNQERPWEQPYTETGYATREDFAIALAQIVPRFYQCKEFRFTFGRYQGWPNTDSFTVTVDGQGKVTSVSQLAEDENY